MFFFVIDGDFFLDPDGDNDDASFATQIGPALAQNSKEIYKRNQDEPKKAIRSFKESFQKP